MKQTTFFRLVLCALLALIGLAVLLCWGHS